MIKKLPWLILECLAIIGAVLFLYSFDGVMQFWDEATDYAYDLTYTIPVVGQFVLTLSAFAFVGWYSYGKAVEKKKVIHKMLKDEHIIALTDKT